MHSYWYAIKCFRLTRSFLAVEKSCTSENVGLFAVAWDVATGHKN